MAYEVIASHTGLEPLLLALALLASTAVFAEFGQLARSWQNNGKVPAMLHAAGISPAAVGDHTM